MSAAWSSARWLARSTLVVVIDAVLLLLLSRILPGLTIHGAWPAIGLAAAIGVANAVVWPLILRFTLPFTVLTLGLGALVLNAGLIYAVAWLFDDVELTGIGSAVALVLLLTAATTFLSTVLALDRSGDLWSRHVVRRQLRRTSPPQRTDIPGLLLLEIDGLAAPVLRRAIRDGNAPALAARLQRDGYRIHRWHTDWSSQTGACQAGLLHGDNDDMPAFRWWEKDRGRAVVTNHPRDAQEIERRHSDGRGLLHEDGASRANILSGDAPHSMMTMSTVLDRSRHGGIGQDYYAYFASPFGVARTLLRTLLEVACERVAAIRQVRADIRPRVARGWKYALVRAYATVIQLDLQIAAVTADILAGRPVIYSTFLAYDEVAHHSGVERPDTLATLRRVDRAIALITQAIVHAPRPYELVVLSDHGQSQGATFRQRYGVSLEQLVAEHGTYDVQADTADTAEGRGSLQAGVAELAERPGALGAMARGVGHEEDAGAARADVPEVSVMASGNLGLITFPREPGRLTRDRVEALSPGLIDALRSHAGIGFLLVRDEDDRPLVLGAHGSRRLDDGSIEGVDPLAPYGPHAATVVARTDRFPHCADIMVNSTYWDEPDEVAAFEELVGSHGGLGGDQSHAFVMAPAALAWPDAEVVGAEAVHRILRGWLAGLGHDAYRD